MDRNAGYRFRSGEVDVAENRLSGQASPYLIQHSGDPVDWYPWTEEAFEKARREKKPVFLSIGYSTCHWCHVMERESFENEEIAGLLNERYVSVKVDREERPDIDDVYMKAVTAMTGSGGWPLSVFLTPEGEPFYGGTYFPPEDRYGRPGFKRILNQLADAWESDRGDVASVAKKISEALSGDGYASNRRSLLSSPLTERAFQELRSFHDPVNGGFGMAPKFPQPSYLSILLRYWYRTGSPEAMSMLRRSLDHMAAGGIRDHVGGGFHRYTTDEAWKIPHFEKMLYDQALLAKAYTEAYVATGEVYYEKIARSILDYVIRDMTDGGGGYMSAEDADSCGMEGGFYLWTPREIEGLRGAGDAGGLMETYGVTEGGNFERGRSILNITGITGMGEEERSRKLMTAELETEKARAAMFEYRERRDRPFRDDKVIAAWNGLMISAMATAGAVFQDERYTESAIHAAAFVRSSMHGGGKLKRYFRAGAARGDAFLDDYAGMASGFIDLYQATSAREFLDAAEEMAEELTMGFADDVDGGFFLSSEDKSGGPGRLPARSKPFYDGALPSGNSMAASVMHRLGVLLGQELYSELALGTVQAFSGRLEDSPASMCWMLGTLEDIEGPEGDMPPLGCTGIFCKKM